MSSKKGTYGNPKQKLSHEIEIKQMEKSLSFLEAKSLIGLCVHCTEKWNRHYKAHPSGDHYKFLFARLSLSYDSSCEEIFRLQTSHYLLNYHKLCIG